MSDHLLSLTPAGFHCSVCHWSWDHLPSSLCPGVRRYHDRAHAPRHLLSAVELRDTDIPTPDAPSACIATGRGWQFLFDAGEPALLALLPPGERLDTHVGDLRQDDAEAALCWALHLQAHPESWLVVDAVGSEIGGRTTLCALAIARPDGKVLLSTRIRPHACPAGSAKHLRFADHFTHHAPALEQVYPALARLIAEKILVCYEARVAKLVTHAIRKLGLPPLAVTWHSAAEEYARWRNEFCEDRDRYRLHLLPGATHEPAADCRAILALITQMAARGDPQEERDLALQVAMV